MAYVSVANTAQKLALAPALAQTPFSPIYPPAPQSLVTALRCQPF
jgi:hypothetical protein